MVNQEHHDAVARRDEIEILLKREMPGATAANLLKLLGWASLLAALPGAFILAAGNGLVLATLLIQSVVGGALMLAASAVVSTLGGLRRDALLRDRGQVPPLP